MPTFFGLENSWTGYVWLNAWNATSNNGKVLVVSSKQCFFTVDNYRSLCRQSFEQFSRMMQNTQPSQPISWLKLTKLNEATIENNAKHKQQSKTTTNMWTNWIKLKPVSACFMLFGPKQTEPNLHDCGLHRCNVTVTGRRRLEQNTNLNYH